MHAAGAVWFKKGRCIMPRNPLKVLIIGAGAGGLCLAQGLKRDGVAAEVFERDPTPSHQAQGYRLSISATGSRALKACLPDTVFERLTQNTAQPSEAVTFLDHRLNRLLEIDLRYRDRHAIDAERPVSRAALRHVLLEGLDDVVRFGKRFIGFDDVTSGAVAAHFEDGTTAVGDVLVGADGAGSRVRSILLPEARRADTGLIGIGGKLPLTAEVRASTPLAILRGPTPILGPRGCFMFGSAVQYRDLDTRERAVDSIGGTLAGPASALDDREEYVMWGFTARRERFALPGGDKARDGQDLKLAVERLMGDWHPTLRRLVQRTDPSVIKTFAVKTSVPVGPWKTRNVTLLGDALHNMPPFRGVGANTALWDAAVLHKALVAVDNGEKHLLRALAAYERAMIDHGFRAVRTSLGDMARFHAENWIERTLTKFFFRALDLVPGLRNAVVAGR